MKKILKYILWLFTISLLVVATGIFAVYIRYQSTVRTETGKMEVHVKPGELGKWVNPFIGTGGFPSYTSGDDIPGPTMPFGMVRLSPDTRFFLGKDFFEESTVSNAGYYYADNHIMGFSHTRLIGTGAYEGGHFRVYPSAGEQSREKYLKGKYHRFSHNNEIAFPGYYAVKFKRQRILAELTATERTGVHRYTFSDDEVPHILIDVSSSLGKGKTAEGEIHVSESGEITGAIMTFGNFASRYGGQKIFFAARFNKPFQAFNFWSGKKSVRGNSSIKADTLGIDFVFDKKSTSEKIEMRLGISYVSIENARENRETETGGLTFEEIQKRTAEKWEEKLALVKIEGGTGEQRTIFYSALYRSMQMPTLFNDVNGDYKGFDKQIHKTEGFQYFTDLSLWDTFRTIHPLFTMILPDFQRDMLVSLVKMAEQGGVLPRWPSGYGYTGSMIGASADIVISETYLKEIRDFDVETAYQAMKKAALGIDLPQKGFRPREGIEKYMKYGYCPADSMGQAVSKTLEYAWADDAIAKLAAALGNSEDSALFSERAQYYRNVWNPETQYFQPRNADGSFVEKFKPLLLTYFDFDEEYTDDYVEGSALQWRWLPFYDAEGLVSLFKDTTYFVSELNQFFEKADPERGTWNPGSYYWHGNEPDIHAAYLFNIAGRPDLTQKWVRWILDNKYGAGYDGLDGDDDAGTLSAWYIFSSLGFYPVAGSDVYQIGAPLYEKSTIKLGEKELKIETKNYSPENMYVQKVWLNGQLLDRWWLKHAEIAEGGTLVFEMSEVPTVK
ncbi:MAG TPA: GH92 family glycosyl hydrolase [Draconibacterium sp.]|nr:GH92 family glycosyl hydrolase [Draconibacterium sp.]